MERRVPRSRVEALLLAAGVQEPRSRPNESKRGYSRDYESNRDEQLPQRKPSDRLREALHDMGTHSPEMLEILGDHLSTAQAETVLRRTSAPSASRESDTGTEKLLRDLLDRIYKMNLLAIPSLRVGEVDSDSNDPLIAKRSKNALRKHEAEAENFMQGEVRRSPTPSAGSAVRRRLGSASRRRSRQSKPMAMPWTSHATLSAG
jgi:hypothetical protein